MMPLHIRDKRKGDAAVRALTKQRNRTQADAETGIQGAGVRFEKLEKRIKELEGIVEGQQIQIRKLWAWKRTQEGKDDIS